MLPILLQFQVLANQDLDLDLVQANQKALNLAKIMDMVTGTVMDIVTENGEDSLLEPRSHDNNSLSYFAKSTFVFLTRFFI